ncbi:hypothetical protein AMIS_2760 [Actinoplanes missouriensis 431]|uniref:Helix-turn-helix domain-containing protein n=1 Tax=Actinoplanes missouriensis (strain ATCC 14538 / DSM 43046 / CBS 188.64 / JCM 3121 / NBRC 102363 / NCIMB 12654 / NRRL B-3342 / UNCC 431) TaxID=512565 RepID=I0GXK9_ACTM4|nr:hypothetical protein [Actinoplanes missouriensis]KOX45243.1 hypothetical protein ADL19_23235 [Streptomyces purpurogeneiscleroticus]BAL85496.1 hypothetical protein AMIS_2760 [Actinoplanes missouriensis 431]
MKDLELITKAELAELIRKPKSWVDEAVTARKIPFTRLGSRDIRFSREDITEIHRMGKQPAITA